MLIGNVTSLPGSHKLYVNGSMMATEVNVAEVVNWSDYVFHDNYNLPKLNEVEKFISINKHLPSIPSEADIKENGINLGEMDALLLKKIEELTLYTIDQQKLLDKQNELLQQQQQEIEKLKAAINQSR